MTLCSVLIPAYNVEPYVAKSIESALSQTLRDIEVIVVNDGSTDRTADAIYPYRDRIVYIEQENRGLAGARNRALEEARGDYITLLDADDSWLPHRLELMVRVLEQSPEVGFVTSDCFIVTEVADTVGTFYSSRPRRERFRFDDQPYWITQYNFIFIMAVIRRELFTQHGHFDESLSAAEDWDLWLRFIAAGERVDLIDQPLGHYLVRRESLSYDPRRIWPNELRILERAGSAIESRDIKGVQGRLNFARGKNALLNEYFADAARFFWKATTDTALPLHRRLEAFTASIAPKQAWKWYSRNLPTTA